LEDTGRNPRNKLEWNEIFIDFVKGMICRQDTLKEAIMLLTFS
jgi:hypothetical protein